MERVNILLVDDQPAKLLGYETILGGLDANLIKAGSGREALEHLLKEEIAVVLIDVCMPELDGFELADLIRQHPRCQKTSIIFVSAIHMTDLDRLKGFDFGAVDYVSVPVVPEILRARVGVFLDLYRKNEQLERFNRHLEQRVLERTGELEASNEQLRASEERLRLAVLGAGMGTWDVDLVAGTTHLSENHFRMLGSPIPPDGVTTLEEIRRRIHPEDVGRLEDEAQRAMACHSMFTADYRVIRADDEAVVWLSGYGRFLHAVSGKAVRFVGVVFDVTRRKKMEEALRLADRRKDEFLAILAHELRNPLHPIRSAANVLRMEQSTEEEMSWSRDVIDRQVDHLTRLIDDLLDTSRITTGKLDLRKETVALADVVQNAVEACRPIIEERGHELTVSLPANPVYMNADLVRLSQAFVNLLNNAAKYTSPKGRIGLVAEHAGNEIVVRVCDNGAGIAREKIPYLFDLFYQAEEEASRTTGGLGIGLTLVRQLVEMHGGRVLARSAGVDQGSEFEVILPSLEWNAPPAATKRDHRAELTPVEASRRILVVDDNRDSAESLAILLRLRGHVVRSTLDGERALRDGSEFRPEIMILDLGMPNMSGFDVARATRTHEWGREVRLIALTGWGQEADRRRVHDAGFDAHLTKPLKLDDLRRILAEVPVGLEPPRKALL